ncbi:MAG: nicotinate phosphoribosyltransferase [Microcystaceae cyanobacterium]
MNPSLLNVTLEDNPLITDLYQLTMAACYCGEEIDQTPASFELFVRRLPKGFNYLIAMGIGQVIEYLKNFHFTEAQIKGLQDTGIFDHVPSKFWDSLREAKFTGDVWGIPEGTVFFANEPVLRVDAPLWQAQLIETFLLNTINYQSLIGTRAARIRDVAGKDAILLEFGTRRAFSPQGAIWAARAALAGGLDATSNVLAALKLGQKPSGTMAHALVMAITALSGEEDEAFEAFHRYFPKAPLLIDTYDTIEAAQRLAKMGQEGGRKITGVRLDSGDLMALSKTVRSILPNTKIFASGDLDEWEIDRLKASGAKIDGYGLGTKLVTGNPVNGVYKLVEIKGIPTIKQSSQKMTYPGKKQIFRRIIKGRIQGDRLGLIDDTAHEHERPLLRLMMHLGQPVLQKESIGTIRQRTETSVASLPPETRKLRDGQPMTVRISYGLEQLRQSLLR